MISTIRPSPFGCSWFVALVEQPPAAFRLKGPPAMPVKNRFAELLPEITAWRRDFHEHPELLFEVHRTAARVAELCRSFGCDEVVEGIGRTGVVAVIRGRTDTRAG
jgi:hypothetical protein